MLKKLPHLVPGDAVEIIAPASRSSHHQLEELKQLLEAWDLHCIIQENIFGDDVLCAHKDEVRFTHLKNALRNPVTKAIICVRGGYGSARLIPQLATLASPEVMKLFVGMSDITALHLYFQQNWGWPTLHASSNSSKLSPESILALKSVLFGNKEYLSHIELTPLNEAAAREQVIHGAITGGNLAIIQSGIGTGWQMRGEGKIILLEEIGERAYRIDRMLEHLTQAKIFKNSTAVLLGDFLEAQEPDGSNLVEAVLKRFAADITVPVLSIKGVGHGITNFPIPLGTEVMICLGNKIKLRLK